MNLVKQINFTSCGQACIAMIANKPIETVIKDMKTDGPTSIGQLIEILDKYGISHAERNTRISKKNPEPYPFSILTVHTNGEYTHWTLLYNSRYYDPEFGLIEGEYTFGRITSFTPRPGTKKISCKKAAPLWSRLCHFYHNVSTGL